MSLRHISEITKISDEFADLINSGRFIYLDGHVIINSEKYVEYFNGHPLKLTEYAKRHMSECCLDFKRTYDDPDYEYTFGELHKDELAPIESREADEAQLRMLNAAFAELEEENLKLNNMPTVNQFGQAVRFHMERCGVTEDDVADRSGLGVNTVSNIICVLPVIRNIICNDMLKTFYSFYSHSVPEIVLPLSDKQLKTTRTSRKVQIATNTQREVCASGFG